MTDTQVKRLHAINEKINSLVEMNETLLAKNKKLEEEIYKLKKDGSLNELNLVKFEKAVQNDQPREIETEAKGVEEIRQQLTHHIEDISQCIDWLQKMY